jgi:hypothetical protein
MDFRFNEGLQWELGRQRASVDLVREHNVQDADCCGGGRGDGRLKILCLVSNNIDLPLLFDTENER